MTRKDIEYHCDRIEATLAAQHCPGRITGGTVGPRGIRFVLQPAPFTTYEQVEVALDLPMERSDAGIVLSLPNNHYQLEVRS